MEKMRPLCVVLVTCCALLELRSAAPRTDPAVTDPAVTDPAVTDPALTDPAVTDPAVTDPAVTDPALTDPAVTDPALTDPAVTDPAVTDPAVTDPAVTDPAVTDPAVTDPAVTDPAVTDPAVTDPALTDPTVTDPAVTDPAVTDPAVTDPAVTDPIVTDPTVTDPAVPDPAVTDPLQEKVHGQRDGDGDCDRVTVLSEGSDCRCKCVVRPLSRSARGRVEEGSARVGDSYTVETITRGPQCKCACIAPQAALDPCQTPSEAGEENDQLSSLLDWLEGSVHGMDLLKLHSVTNKLQERIDQLEKERFGGESSSAEVMELSSQETHKNSNQVTKTGPNGLIIRGMTFYKSESDPMVADDGEPGENLFEYDGFSGDGPINFFIEENLLQHKTPRPRTRHGQRTFKSKPVHPYSVYRKTSEYRKTKEASETFTSTHFPSSTKHRLKPRPREAEVQVETTVDSIPFPDKMATKDSTEALITSVTPPTTMKTADPTLKDQATTAGPTSARAATVSLTPDPTPHLKPTSSALPPSTHALTPPAPDHTPAPQTTPGVTAPSPATITTFLSEPMKAEEIHKRKPADCQDTLATISEPVTHNTYGRSEGAWMRDSKSDSGEIYIANYFYGNNLLEFASLEVFKQGHFTNSYKLPYNWIGTGHVVYHGAFYYNRAFSRDIIKFDLLRRHVAAWTLLHDAAFEESSSPWEWRSYSDVNMAADESGLWIVYPALDEEGFHQEVVVLSRLNPVDLSMQPETTWRTGLRRSQYGNCFIVCGVLYFVDSYNQREANLEYAFDTHTNTQMIPRMPFSNNYTYTTKLDYNPREGLLYAWDNGHQVTYNVTFANVEP